MLSITINDAMQGKNDSMPDKILTEEKKVMPGENEYKQTASKLIKEAQEILKQEAQQDCHDVIMHLDMALESLDDGFRDDEDIEKMKNVKDRKKMPYEEDDEPEEE
jgi:hypothetical protein